LSLFGLLAAQRLNLCQSLLLDLRYIDQSCDVGIDQ